MVLKGKTAVVTGAAGTMGLAVVRALLEDGAQVALVDIDALRLDGLVRSRFHGRRCADLET